MGALPPGPKRQKGERPWSRGTCVMLPIIHSRNVGTVGPEEGRSRCPVSVVPGVGSVCPTCSRRAGPVPVFVPHRTKGGEPPEEHAGPLGPVVFARFAVGSKPFERVLVDDREDSIL